MVNLEFVCNGKQKLNQHDVDRIIRLLREGGLCILPSDSSYILTGLVSDQKVSKDIDLLLERNGAPMSLTFGDLKKITEKMDCRNQACEFLKKLTPYGLTFVMKPLKKAFNRFSTNCLYADGTIGVRLSRSVIETQIADFFPMPSVPIRNSKFTEVFTAEEAWKIVSERSAKLHVFRKIAMVDDFVINPGQLSTVVREKMQDGYQYIEIMRKGAISTEMIRKVALECKYKGIV